MRERNPEYRQRRKARQFDGSTRRLVAKMQHRMFLENECQETQSVGQTQGTHSKDLAALDQILREGG